MGIAHGAAVARRGRRGVGERRLGGGRLRGDGRSAKRVPYAATEKVRGAKDRRLEVSKVVIPSGVVLDRHDHEGSQVARVVKGPLHYTGYTGKVTVRRGEPGDATVVRRIKAGQTG